MSRRPDKLRAWAEIDLSRLECNLRAIRSFLPPHLKYISVVKADAYGHGFAPVVTRLMRSGADLFAVANIEEAAAIRELGYGWPILVLSAILPSEIDDVVAYDVIPSISSIAEAEELNLLGERLNRQIALHIKVDTGMGRLGVWHEHARPLYDFVAHAPCLKLTGTFTHFSCADSDRSFTELQRRRFLDVLSSVSDLLPEGLLVHADNSAGIESFPKGGPLNGARIGLFQFGVRPYSDSLLDEVQVDPVFSFHSRVGLVKQLPAGTGISYGRTRVLEAPARTAIVTAGYGDGIPTGFSNRGKVLIRGQRCPVLGRVTMDQTVVDATHLPDVAPGDLVTLIGQQEEEEIPVEEFSVDSGQIPWEAFTSITKRVHRIYKADSLR